MNIKTKLFGFTNTGESVYNFSLSNKNNISVDVINFGATIVSFKTPDKNGEIKNIILNYDNLKKYLSNPFYFGSTIGRYCNKIANGHFLINKKVYNVEKNDNTNHLHGGTHGFSNAVWDGEIIDKGCTASVKMSHFSPDGEGGFPGNLNVSVYYSLDEYDRLTIEYTAKSDCDTIINLTNHSYFNLSDAGSGQILDHKLAINSDFFLPIDDQAIPTGKIIEVNNSPFDFRESTRISDRLDFTNPQISLAYGYNHNYILKGDEKKIKFAAELSEEKSGRSLEIKTTEPGLQFYSGYFLQEEKNSSPSEKYGRYNGLCLETQHYPDSPNQPNFPTTILKKDELFKSKTIIRHKLRK